MGIPFCRTLTAQTRAQLNKPMDNPRPHHQDCFCYSCEAWDKSAAIAAKEQAEARRSAATCSRIADPEGKHLEVCRLQLAAVVRQRDQLAALIEREAKDIDASGDEIAAKQLRRAVREILSENVDVLAPAGEKTPNH